MKTVNIVIHDIPIISVDTIVTVIVNPDNVSLLRFVRYLRMFLDFTKLCRFESKYDAPLKANANCGAYIILEIIFSVHVKPSYEEGPLTFPSIKKILMILGGFFISSYFTEYF